MLLCGSVGPATVVLAAAVPAGKIVLPPHVVTSVVEEGQGSGMLLQSPFLRLW